MSKFLSREKHWNWKGGISLAPKICLDCGKKITYLATYCKKHFAIKERHPRWKGGWKNNRPKCIDCGNYIGGHSNAKRCRKCHLLWQKGENNPCWRGGISKNLKFYRQRRRAIFKAGGKLTLKTIQQIYEDNIKKYGTLTCYLCLKPIKFGKDCLEHKQPLSRGGNNKKSNLAIAHKSCNSKKHNKTVEEFLSLSSRKNVLNFSILTLNCE